MLDRAYGMREAPDNGQGQFERLVCRCAEQRLLQQGGYRGESLRHSGGHCDRRVSAAAAYHSRQDANGVPRRTIDRTALKLGTGSVEQLLGCEQDFQLREAFRQCTGRC